MKTWLSSRHSRLVLLFALVVHIERCVQSSSGERLLSGGLDQNVLSQHLKRLQESLRWIRSPKTGGRFRPWGGKRNPARAKAAETDLALCSSSDERYFTKCFEILSKRDKFRPWGGKRNTEAMPATWHSYLAQGQGEPEYADVAFPSNPIRGGSSPVGEEFVKRTPGFDDVIESTLNFHEGPTSRELLLKALGDGAAIPRGRIWPQKRQRFNPWGGKRSGSFPLWVGNRQPTPPRPAAEFYYPFNDTSLLPKSPLEGPAPAYDSNELPRVKREATGERGEEEGALCPPTSSPTIEGENPRRDSPAPSGLEALLGSARDTKRSFNPWAGRKRSERETRLARNDAVGHLATQWGPTDGLAKPPDEDKYLPAKRQTFNPWAGKRSFPPGHDPSLESYAWGQGTERAFNSWVGKRSANLQ